MQVALFSPLLDLCVIWNWRSRTARVRHSAIEQRLRHTVDTQPLHGRIERRWKARS